MERDKMNSALKDFADKPERSYEAVLRFCFVMGFVGKGIAGRSMAALGERALWNRDSIHISPTMADRLELFASTTAIRWIRPDESAGSRTQSRTSVRFH